MHVRPDADDADRRQRGDLCPGDPQGVHAPGLKIIRESISARSDQSDEPRSVIADAHREFEEIKSLDTARELASSMEVLGVFYEYRGGVGQGGAQAVGSWLGV